MRFFFPPVQKSFFITQWINKCLPKEYEEELRGESNCPLQSLPHKMPGSRMSRQSSSILAMFLNKKQGKKKKKKKIQQEFCRKWKTAVAFSPACYHFQPDPRHPSSWLNESFAVVDGGGKWGSLVYCSLSQGAKLPPEEWNAYQLRKRTTWGTRMWIISYCFLLTSFYFHSKEGLHRTPFWIHSNLSAPTFKLIVMKLFWVVF